MWRYSQYFKDERFYLYLFIHKHSAYSDAYNFFFLNLIYGLVQLHLEDLLQAAESHTS